MQRLSRGVYIKRRHFCTLHVAKPKNLSAYKKFKNAFGFRVQENLAFTQYVRYSGVRKFQWGYVGINFTIFGLWQYAFIYDPRLIKPMQFWFTADNGADGITNPLAWILSSLSHQDYNHIFGNMFFFWVLSRRLYEFLGPLRLSGLMLAGSIGGTAANHFSPTWKPDFIDKQPIRRYGNIIQGEHPSLQRSLGASDSVLAMVAAFYLIFPRQKLHLFKTLYFIERFGWRRHKLKSINQPILMKVKNSSMGMWVNRYTKVDKAGNEVKKSKLLKFIRKFRVSAIWFLPSMFLVDFLSLLPTPHADRPEILDTTGHYAHVGGFIAGTLFHFAIARPLKMQTYPHPLWDLRRAYLTVISLAILLKLFMHENPENRIVGMKFNLDGFHELVNQTQIIQSEIDSGAEPEVIEMTKSLLQGFTDYPADLLAEVKRSVEHQYFFCDDVIHKVRDWLETQTANTNDIEVWRKRIRTQNAFLGNLSYETVSFENYEQLSDSQKVGLELLEKKGSYALWCQCIAEAEQDQKQMAQLGASLVPTSTTQNFVERKYDIKFSKFNPNAVDYQTLAKQNNRFLRRYSSKS